MKYLSTIIPILLAFLMTFIAIPMDMQAQQSVDGNRLNRDINIMENILSEMFRIRPKTTGDRVDSRYVVTSVFSGSNSDVRGTYLPGFGVIFQIPRPGNSPVYIMEDEDTEEPIYTFYYGDEERDSDEQVTRESITNRIVEFLKDYGSTIGQLPDNEHVMVIYGGIPDRNRNVVFSLNGSRRSSDSDRLPVISASVTRANLSAYRRGSISDAEFRNRVAVSENEQNNTQNRDLRVMANIFETAFEGGDDSSFRVRGSVDYLHLDNFGALFFFDARYGNSNFFSRAVTFPSIVTSDSNSRSRSEAVSAAMEERIREQEEREAEQQKNATAALETFKTELKEYLVDYGRTLSSVETDQHVLLSVSLNSSIEGIPDRIDVQVLKSVLEQMDQGNMSRQQAINQVSLREY